MKGQFQAMWAKDVYIAFGRLQLFSVACLLKYIDKLSRMEVQAMNAPLQLTEQQHQFLLEKSGLALDKNVIYG